MRIVHIIPSLSEGGAPLGTLELAKRQKSSGMDASIVVLSSRDNEFNQSVWPLEFKYLDTKFQLSNSQLLKNSISKTERAIRLLEPEVVHAHLWPAAYISAKAIRKMGSSTPLIVHIRDTPGWLSSTSLRNRLKRSKYRIALSRSNIRMIAVSETAARYARQALRFNDQKIVTVLNAIDTERFPDQACLRSDEKIKIGIVGRLAPEKGHVDLIRARCLMKTNRKLKFFIVGNGSQRESIEELIRQSGFEREFSIVEKVGDLNSFYRNLDLLVLPSRGAEGLPRVVMEAMWCGTPVVATDVAGINEAIRHEQDGLVVPVGRIDALAVSLDRLINDADERSRLGRSSSERARELFQLDRAVEQISLQYKSMLTGATQ